MKPAVNKRRVCFFGMPLVLAALGVVIGVVMGIVMGGNPARAEAPVSRAMPASQPGAENPSTTAAESTGESPGTAAILVNIKRPELPASDKELLAHGNADAFWYVLVSPRGGSPAISEVYHRGVAGKDDAWRQLSAIPARVRGIASQQTDLILAFDDMPWRRIGSGGALIAGTPLPGDRQVFDVACDGSELWALGITKHDDPSARRAATASSPTTGQTSSEARVYHYLLADSKWVDAGPLPKDWLVSLPYSFAIFRGEAYFAFEDSRGLRVMRLELRGSKATTHASAPAENNPSRAADSTAGAADATAGAATSVAPPPATGEAEAGSADWKELPALPMSFFAAPASSPVSGSAQSTSPSPDTRASDEPASDTSAIAPASAPASRPVTLPVENRIDFKLLNTRNRLALWVADQHDAGRIFFFDQTWSASAPFALPAMSPPLYRTVAVTDPEMRLLVASGNDKKIQQQNIASDGHADGTWTPLPGMTRVSVEWVNTVIRYMVGALLVILVIGTAIRRRSAPVTIEKLAADFQPAPLRERISAGLLDMWPIFACLLYLRIPTQQEMLDPVNQAIAAGAYGVYLLYTVLCELIFKRTLGKMVFGLRLVMLDGQPPRAWPLIARNIARVVDFCLFCMPLLLILMTPLRQRLGDSFAGTVVVVPRTEAKESDELEDED